MDPLLQLRGESPGVVAIREQLTKLLQRQLDARRMPPILIQGETGTGKGLLAHALHDASARASSRFVDVNCAAIPETLLEAEMFGVERGAFTDARQAKPGLFQVAHRGTIFLDEIALLPEALQAKLLKAIEDREVRRVGATRSEAVDAWVIAATNADLAGEVAARRFRADLYHRLAVVTVALPPLRERGDDVLMLAEHFLERACADYGIPVKRLTPAARGALAAHAWPGNIRELSNVMERVALLAEETAVTAEALDLRGPSGSEAAPPAPAPSATLESAVGDVERDHLVRALDETGWNVSRAAVRLGVSRNTLRYRMEKYGLRAGATPAPAPAPTVPRATTPAVTPRAPSPAPAPVRERRRLALLRARLGPADAIEHIGDQILELMADKARSFGGRLEEVNHSGIVAAFGLEPVEDAPVRAAHAAVAIVHAVERARRPDLPRVSVRAAIHVDHFSVASAASGPTIDLDLRPSAWRFLDTLLEGGEPDSVVVSETAAPFLERRFDVITLPATSGRAPVYRLSRRDGTPRGAVARLAAFVGRRYELELLRSRFESAQRGHGQVIGVVGDAGIGKSRLLFEFCQTLTGVPVTCLEGRCHSYGTDVPYLPVLEVLRGLFGITEGDTPDATALRVEATLAGLEMEVAATAPYLLHLLGLKEGAERLTALNAEEIKARVVDVLRTLVLRASRRQPVVLVIEDLHWIDRASEEVLGVLADAVGAARLFLVATYRSGYRPPWIERSYATQIALLPLADEEGANVVRAVLGTELDESLLATILAKGEGNPFFLEELARAVREQDGRPGGRAGGSVVVPDTVHEVLLARIDRLPADARRVLQVAAVVGREAPAALLAAVAPLPADELRRALLLLRSAEFLHESGVAPDEAYAFKHALTHEVAYASMPAGERRAVHAAIVDTLERTARDRASSDVERLAGHALSAELWEKAARYLREAGRRAGARSAHREAVVRFEQALDALAHLPEQRARVEEAIDIRFDLRTSLTPLGEHARIFEHLQAAERLATTLDDPRRLGRAVAYAADYFRLMGRQDEAVAAGRRALAIAESLGDFAMHVAATIYLAQSCHDQGRYGEAVDYLRRGIDALKAVPAADTLGLPYVPFVHSRTWLVLCLAERGEFAEGAARAEEALRVAESVDQPFSIVSASAGLGRLLLRRGDPARAIPILERGLELSRTWNIRLLFPMVASGLGSAYLLAGRVAEALPVLEEALAQHAAMRGRAGQSIRESALAAAYLAAGGLTAATQHATRALTIAGEHGERGNEAYAWLVLGDLAARAEPARLEEAGRAYAEAMARADSLAMRPLAAQCRLAQGMLRRRAGDVTAARELLAAAYGEFAALGMPLWLARAEAERSALG